MYHVMLMYRFQFPARSTYVFAVRTYRGQLLSCLGPIYTTTLAKSRQTHLLIFSCTWTKELFSYRTSYALQIVLMNF